MINYQNNPCGFRRVFSKTKQLNILKLIRILTKNLKKIKRSLL